MLGRSSILKLLVNLDEESETKERKRGCSFCNNQGTGELLNVLDFSLLPFGALDYTQEPSFKNSMTSPDTLHRPKVRPDCPLIFLFLSQQYYQHIWGHAIEVAHKASCRNMLLSLLSASLFGEEWYSGRNRDVLPKSYWWSLYR